MNTAVEGEKVKTDFGLQCLVTIAAYYRIPADPKNIIHLLAMEGKVFSDGDIIRGAKLLKIKARYAEIIPEKLIKMTFPAMLKTSMGYFLILKADSERCLVITEKNNTPHVITMDELCEEWNGEILLFIPRNINNRDTKFGFKWFIPTIIKYKAPLLEVLLAAFMMQILALLSPLITQSVIDKVLVHNSLSTLDILAIGLLLIAVFETMLSVARNYVFTHTASKIDVILSCRLFNHLFRLPMRYFETRRVGDTVARVRELENIRRFLTGVPMTTLLDSLFIIVYIIVMIFYSTKLTLVTVASIPILAIISALVTPVLKSRLDEKFNCGAESQSYLVEAVTGVQTIKSFAIEPSIQKKWEGLLANYTKAGFKTSILSGNAGAVAQFVQKIFDLAILWLGARLVIDGQLTVGQLVAFRMLAGRVSSPVLRLVQMWQDFQQTSISVQRLGDIFNSKPEPTMDGSKTRLPAIRGDIRFDKVSFRYRPDGAEVIKNMSFGIRPNTVVGIVGRSGSGKSTISKLVQRLYIPESGKILIDGVDLSLADPNWLRTQIGVVLQENFLFNASVRENIALQNPAASMDEIIRAAKIAGAHEFILELSEGYDTMVGEKGTGLSGGQKQRIAIARALLTNPKILIFDEATSALDYESESIIQQNLKEICKGRTVLIIAHRLSTLKDADLIMVVERGQIAEYGTKDKLIEAQGLYYHLLSQQQNVR
ncbi:MAG: type I secretion system permease/ATPase [Oscillospiraceae bacterium]|nr:type I secretion system permease/ATPase [Oscillospiraceae bacterium]